VDFSDRPGAALVAGGSGGIGSAIVRKLSQYGSAVVSTYRTKETEEAQARLDLTDAKACRDIVAAVAEAHGGLHTVVYAAGPHVPMMYLSRVPPERFADQIAQDTVGFFNLMSAALPYLRESRGSVVAVTTAATRRHPARDGLSAAPKAAVEALVRGIAVEEGRYGVRANCVGPGMLTDGMAGRLMASGDLDERALAVTKANIPLGRFGTAEDVAEAVCFLAYADYVTGQKLDVDGGYTT
jgi:3-oxoacyl-[acyl-carrier protein] reductase